MDDGSTRERPDGGGEERGLRIVLDGGPLTLAVLDGLLGRRLSVEITEEVWKRIEAGAEAVRKIAAGTEPAYGVNTGFGSLCRRRISSADLAALQRNLIVSHAVGVGPPVPPEIVRWMMLFKIHALTHGVSGVSRPTVTCLVNLLCHDALPVIPVQGSLGASGDLAPLAHMVLPMIGLGQVSVNNPAGFGRSSTSGTRAQAEARGPGRRSHADNGAEGIFEPAAEALPRMGVKSVTLGPKEGLALINGTQFMTAYAAAILVRARRLVKHADVAATMSLEAVMGSVKPFDERLHRLRPHRGAMETANNVRRLMIDSDILASHEKCLRVQDPYSIRCVPQVHGASRDAVRHAAEAIETEINSVTDNPLILDGEVISGGLFHGQPVALVLDYLAMALSELAAISERRTYLLLSGVEGLPVLLMQDTGLNSGLMLPQYTAAALVSENKGLCTPACVDSIPTSLGQEDHVSMGARSAVKCLQVLENTETVLAIEMLCAAQALDYRAPLRPGIGPRTALAELRRHIEHAETDRLYGEDMGIALWLLRTGAIVRAVDAAVGKLQ